MKARLLSITGKCQSAIEITLHIAGLIRAGEGMAANDVYHREAMPLFKAIFQDSYTETAGAERALLSR